MLEISDEKLEIILSMTAFDNAFIRTFFDRNIVEFLLRLILKKPELSVETVTFEHVLDDPVSKGVRLDIRAVDDAGNWMDIEFQINPREVNGRRLRYYHSRMDVQMLERGKQYTELADACVIFICRGDPIGKGKPMYCFQMKDQDNEVLEDGQLTLILNADFPGDWEYKNLMEDLKSADSKDMHYDVLKERMQTVKEKEGEIMEAGHVLEDYLKKQEDKMKSEIVANMLKDKMPEETIVRLAVVSPEFVKQVQATM
ncbi:Rpn family recombination-promoting nuclease/putative transposase [Faecalibaculum rodentium]|uniref:Rpn family recombination-promoting nuclease/putative transposase n=1 Tax=Faecalibaculum rodentium TaxID=1702221 RepID=UPI0023EFEF77|nr:Rpn family recombination-promoting nuclease/putative transposase [Faecalibaculum rodentium]